MYRISKGFRDFTCRDYETLSGFREGLRDFARDFRISREISGFRRDFGFYGFRRDFGTLIN